MFHNRVAEDFLLQQAEFAPLRDKLLNGAADFYKKLEVDLTGQDDRPSLQSLSQAFLALGKLTQKVGSREEAIGRMRQSVAICRRLAEGTASNDAARAELGRSLIELGTLVSSNENVSDAEQTIREGISDFRGTRFDGARRRPLCA